VIPPIHLSTIFAFDGLGGKRDYDYSRSGNPTRDHLARALADLEGGANAVVTSTGMAAVTLVLQLLKPCDRVVATHDCYGGTHRALVHLAKRGHFDLEFCDLTQPGKLEQALEKPARLLWVETPSNPLLRVTDIGNAARAARQAGTLLVVDNTFLSPALQLPLSLGADLVVHSTTKYLNGHSDVVGGAVVANDGVLGDELAWWANCLGLTGSPFDSYLTLRGLRTLQARMRIHQENAVRIVATLVSNANVARVYYPGLPDHPGHPIACTQQSGFGGMVSFDLRGGERAVNAFLTGLRCFSLAESLGGVESLIAHPATMTHAAMDPAARDRAGIHDSLLRLSVGIEDGDDLVAAIEEGLARVGEMIALRTSRASTAASA
jgi:cystathionine gamma-synthase